MKNTTNYGLKKPEKTDFYDVNVQNENMDTIDELLKALEEGGGGDVSTAGYNEETDSLWVLKNGEKLDVMKLYTERRDLYMTTSNEGNFEAYAGNISGSTVTSRLPSLTLGSEMVVTLSLSNNEMGQGVAISELIDLSKYKTIHLNHTSTSTISNLSAFVKLFVTNAKSPKMTSIAVVELLKSGATTNNGDVTLDVSAIEGECYIGIEVGANSSGGVVTTSTRISNFYMD